MPNGWVHTQLKSGRAIVLVDGLDEVSISQRGDVYEWLKELVNAFPGAHYIVTSRPYAAKEGWMDTEDFKDALLQPMELADIYSFIDHWHNAVREELREDEEIAALEPLAKHLKEDVKRNRSVRNLATNPLLCAMLCALNRDRRQQLPEDRIELYEACSSLLLERRDKERHVDLTDYPVLNYRQKRLLLEDLAYWMIKNNWSQVALELVDERFERKLKDMPGIVPGISGSGVRRLFVERSGIIREPVVEQIDFTHRTFEEFLAAEAAVDEMDIGLLIRNADNDQWREVIILATGLANRQLREKLIKGLITRGDEEKEHRYQFHLLAVSCLETSLELSQEIKAEVEQRLRLLVPPKNMTDAKALATSDLAVTYLARKKSYPASTTAACIRTLALLGGDTALEVLEGYANDSRSTVLNELLRAWDYFDRETFARRVLSHTMQYHSFLKLSNPPTLDGINYLVSLTSLEIENCLQISDLSPLAGLTQLTELHLYSSLQVSDLSPLAGLTQLTELLLTLGSQVSDLSPLAGLTQLTELLLTGDLQVSDLSPLAGLTQLTELLLTLGSQVSDLSPLAGLTQLTELLLTLGSQVSDLSPLAGLTQLTKLYLTGSSQVSDLSPLAGLTQLDILVLFIPELSDLSPLANLTRLTVLGLPSNLINTNYEMLSQLNTIRLFVINSDDRNQLLISSELRSQIQFIFVDDRRNNVYILKQLDYIIRDYYRGSQRLHAYL